MLVGGSVYVAASACESGATVYSVYMKVNNESEQTSHSLNREGQIRPLFRWLFLVGNAK